jgi:hypothetical protein
VAKPQEVQIIQTIHRRTNIPPPREKHPYSDPNIRREQTARGGRPPGGTGRLYSGYLCGEATRGRRIIPVESLVLHLAKNVPILIPTSYANKPPASVRKHCRVAQVARIRATCVAKPQEADELFPLNHSSSIARKTSLF